MKRPTKLCRAFIDCQQAFADNRKSYRERLYDILGDVYALAIETWKSSEEREAFYQLPFWRNGKRHAKSRRAFLRHTCEFVIQAKSKNSLKRVSKYAAGLEKLAEKNVPAAKAAARIRKKGGVEALAKSARKQAVKASKSGRHMAGKTTHEKTTVSGLDTLKKFKGRSSSEPIRLIIRALYDASDASSANLRIISARRFRRRKPDENGDGLPQSQPHPYPPKALTLALSDQRLPGGGAD